VRGLRAGRNKSESFAESGLKSCEGVGKRYESQSKQYPSSQQIKTQITNTQVCVCVCVSQRHFDPIAEQLRPRADREFRWGGGYGRWEIQIQSFSNGIKPSETK